MLRRLNIITFQSVWYVPKTSLPNARDSDHIIPVVTMVSMRTGPETNPRSGSWLSASSRTLSPYSSVFPEGESLQCPQERELLHHWIGLGVWPGPPDLWPFQLAPLSSLGQTGYGSGHPVVCLCLLLSRLSSMAKLQRLSLSPQLK